MKELNRVAVDIPQSGIRKIKDLADRQPNVIHLEIGQPDFSVAPHIAQAAKDAVELGFSGYCSNSGLESTRIACTEQLHMDHDIIVDPKEVTITVGAMGGLFNSLLTVIQPGDEVLVPDPGYPNYISTISMLGGKPISYAIRMEPLQGCKLDISDIRNKITRKTKALIMNSPSNPTGWVASKEEVLALLEIAEQEGLYVISDEAYDHFVYTDEGHISPLQFSREENIIGVYSCSKTYAMPGWRVGFSVSSVKIAKIFAKLQEGYCSSTSVVSQKAAEIAMSGPQDIVVAMKETYRKRLLAVIKLCNELGLDVVVPQGSFFMMLKIPEGNYGSPDQLAVNLVIRAGVAVAPGSSFGSNGAGYFRISLCQKLEVIQEGIRRIHNYFK